MLLQPLNPHNLATVLNKRTTEAQRTQRENFCVSFGTFFYLEVPKDNGGHCPPYKSIKSHYVFWQFLQVAHIDIVLLWLK
jgi:hypothetical protein